MCYETLNPEEKKAMDEWMNEMEQAYLDEKFIMERAAEETERRFEHYQWQKMLDTHKEVSYYNHTETTNSTGAIKWQHQSKNASFPATQQHSILIR